MTVEEFVNDLKETWIDEERDASGKPEGCFLIFGKWKDDEKLSYSQTFDSKDSMLLSASQINQDVFDRQHILVLYLNPNWNQPYFELLNTEDYYDK
tara:strand:- start:2 stop:289 length:288 start_codon:yes stop_codon:yes gene_type:complete